MVIGSAAVEPANEKLHNHTNVSPAPHFCHAAFTDRSPAVVGAHLRHQGSLHPFCSSSSWTGPSKTFEPRLCSDNKTPPPHSLSITRSQPALLQKTNAPITYKRHVFKKKQLLCRAARNDTGRLESHLVRGNICQSALTQAQAPMKAARPHEKGFNHKRHLVDLAAFLLAKSGSPPPPPHRHPHPSSAPRDGSRADSLASDNTPWLPACKQTLLLTARLRPWGACSLVQRQPSGGGS